MTAVYTGYDSKGKRFTLRLRSHPWPNQSRRLFRTEFEQAVSDMLALARGMGFTDIRRVVGGARHKSARAGRSPRWEG